MILHDHELSDDAYKVRLLAALLGVALTRRTVDMHPGREHEGEAFRRLNPLGTLPVLVDAELVLREAEAILAYLALRFDAGGTWAPREPAEAAQVAMWLAFASRELAAASKARRIAMLGEAGDLDAAAAAAAEALAVMEAHLALRRFDSGEWFAGEAPTIADVALFPAFALCRDWGLDHDDFPALRRWARQLRRLPGFVTMPGIPDYH